MIFPLLADLQEAHDLPTWGLGVISAMYFVGAVSGQLVLAPYADRGHTRRLLMVGAVLSVLTMVMFAFSAELWQFSLARLLSGLAAGIVPARDPRHARAGRAGAGRPSPRPLHRHRDRRLRVRAGDRHRHLRPVGALGPVPGRGGGPRRGHGPARPRGRPSRGRRTGRRPQARSPRRRSMACSPPFELLRIRGVVVAVLLELAVFLPVGIYDSLWARYLQDKGATTVFVGIGLTLYGIPYVLWAPQRRQARRPPGPRPLGHHRDAGRGARHRVLRPARRARGDHRTRPRRGVRQRHRGAGRADGDGPLVPARPPRRRARASRGRSACSPPVPPPVSPRPSTRPSAPRCSSSGPRW